MVQDHYRALELVIQKANQKNALTPLLIKEINAAVMKQTGSIFQTVFGEIDASKGQYRKGNVSAGNSYFVGYEKVETLVEKLCNNVADKLETITEIEKQLNICFDAHFDLVTIHPFYDGNGRTSRLLMNYLQAYFNLPISIVFKEDKAQYFEALIETRKQEDISIFREFMYLQYNKYLQQEIDKFSNSQKNTKGYTFVF